jgi:hypothetical protein
MFGSMAMYTVVNLMSTDPAKQINIWMVCSILGYCLLPVIFLAIVAIVFSLNNAFGLVLASAVVGWCTVSSTRLFVAALDSKSQRYLIGYPSFLVYVVFVLMTVF